MLYVPTYTQERRPYGSLHPTSSNLNSLPALTICAQRKSYEWCFIPGSMDCVGDFSCDCLFWDEGGGGLTGQPVGPQMDT